MERLRIFMRNSEIFMRFMEKMTLAIFLFQNYKILRLK